MSDPVLAKALIRDPGSFETNWVCFENSKRGFHTAATCWLQEMSLAFELWKLYNTINHTNRSKRYYAVYDCSKWLYNRTV